MTKLFSILIFSVVASTAYAGDRVADEEMNVAVPPLREIADWSIRHFEGKADPMFGKLERCKLYDDGKFILMLNGAESGQVAMGLFGISFPKELVDLKANLKEGFSNHITDNAYGDKMDYKADFRAGVLTVEMVRTSAYGSSAHTVEFHTKSNALKAGRIEQSIGKSKENSTLKLTCAQIPTA